MRRIGPWVLTVSGGASFLLCVALLLLTLRTIWRRDELSLGIRSSTKIRHAINYYGSLSERGWLTLWYNCNEFDDEAAADDFASGDLGGTPQVAGFKFSHESHPISGYPYPHIYRFHSGSSYANHDHFEDATLIFPLWIPIAFTAVLPAITIWVSLRRRRSEFRLRNGLCVNCGYDLRSSPERCPECGAVVRKATDKG
jgi:hypothetical protein